MVASKNFLDGTQGSQRSIEEIREEPEPQPKFIVALKTYPLRINDSLYPADYTINVMVGDPQRKIQRRKQVWTSPLG